MKKKTIKNSSHPAAKPGPVTGFFLIALSSVLCTAAFPSIGLWPLAWIGLVPLFFVLATARAGKAFCAGALFASLNAIGIAYWVFNALYVHADAGFLVSALFLVLIIGVFFGLYYGFFGLAAAGIMQSQCAWPVKSLAVASAWVCVEYMRAHLFSGMPWALFGYSQFRWLNLIQIADITGVYGISFILVAANCCMFQACSVFPDIRKSIRMVLPAIVLVALVLLYGSFCLSLYPARPAVNEGHKIGIIQCSILQGDRWKNETQDMQVSGYLSRTDEAFRQGAGLILWPEAALQTYLQEHIPDALLNLLAEHNGMLLLGGPRYTGQAGKYTFYNSAFLLNKSGIAQVHDKLHLLPFGEFFPLGFIDLLRNKYTGPRHYTAGSQYTILMSKEGKLGTLLCFEILFPELVRGFVKQGAEIIVNISNDAWFGRTSAHYQHFSMAVFRAVEFRRPVVRSANTGISGHIDAAGRIVATLAPFQEGVIVCNPGIGTGETFYCRYGDLFAGFCLAVFLLSLAAARRRS
ncbi:MAG: apolipoprotein N-acyltransferase [Deltaproteobacteria bacterium]|nr:apolipoprotein N-acyltransferase [Deltaproteobacteria bacterium]